MGKIIGDLVTVYKKNEIPAVAQTLCADILDNLRMDPPELPKGGTLFVKKLGDTPMCITE